MRVLAFFIFVSLSFATVRAQDTLYTNTGKVIKGKVIEVNPTEIKYKKADNPDGPTYVLYKSEVVLIHYKNGSKDVFSSEPEATVSANDNTSGSQNTQPTVINYNYTNYPYNGYYRSGINLVVAPSPFLIFRPRGFYARYNVYGNHYRHHGNIRYGGGAHHYGRR